MNEIPVYSEALVGFEAQLATMLPKESYDLFNADAKQLSETHTSPLKLAVGDNAPFFQLPNATNQIVSLENLLHEGPVVIAFYRGTWCPYCNLVLNTYQKILPEIKSFGASLVAISPQNPDSSLDIKSKNILEFEVLSDTGNIVAKQYTTVFKNSGKPIAEAAKLGIDFYSYYDDKSGELPVSSVFVINQNGIVVFAKSEGGDYRQRTEPTEILNALKQIKG